MRSFRILMVVFVVCCWVLVSCNKITSDNKSAFSQNNFETTEPKDSFKFPEAKHYVNDFEDILTQTEESFLDSICSNYDKRTTNQIVIATIDSIEPFKTVEAYSKALFNVWGIGTKEKNNGLLFVVFKRLRQARIEVGRGAENIFTNEFCDTIMDSQLIPHFKNDEYFEGLKEATMVAIKKWRK